MLVLVLAMAQAVAALDQCPQVLNHTCLATSLPILKELPAGTAAV